MQRDSRGFTLIEIIAVLVLVGILGAGGAYAISKAAEAYVFTRDNASMAQKIQAAITRMAVDFTYLDTAATAAQSSDGVSFTYVGDYPYYPQAIGDAPVTETHTITQTGTELLYDGDVLLDNVADGTLDISYLDSGGTDEGSFTADTVIVKATFTVRVADDYEIPYTMQTYVDKTAAGS